jgi:hypothetical protein
MLGTSPQSPPEMPGGQYSQLHRLCRVPSLPQMMIALMPLYFITRFIWSSVPLQHIDRNLPSQNKKSLLPLHLVIQPSFTLVTHGSPFLKGIHFLNCDYCFWVLIISFLLIRGRKKVNNNDIFWKNKKPPDFSRGFGMKEMENFHPLNGSY